MADALKIALILTAVDKASAVFDKAGKKINSNLKGLERTQAVFSKYGSMATIAAGAAITGFGISIHAAEENEIAVRRLEQVYRSMGQDVEKASKQSQDYASKLEFQIGVEDEAIMAVQSKLAAFKKVSDQTARMNGIMDRATAAAYDLGATGFGDASSNAIKLGKLLENPTKNLNALSRAGIQFSAQEKKKIEALQKSGKLQVAQDIILKSIEKRVGGVAKATATATAKAKVAWSEVTESLGKALLPTFTNIVEKLNTIIPKLQVWIEKNGPLILTTAKYAVGLLALALAFRAAAFGIGVYNSFLVVTEALTIPLVASGGIVLAVIAGIAAAAYLIYDNWGAIANWFSNLWEKIKKVFITAWNFIKKIFWDYSPAVLIYRNWSKIVAFFQGLWEKVKQKFWAFIDFIKTLPSKMWQAGKNMVMGIWEGIKSKWNAFADWFTEKYNWLSKKLSWSKFGSAQANAAGRAQQASEQYNVMMQGSSSGGGYDNYNSSSSVYNPVSKSNTTLQYAPVITVNGGATQADADLVNNNTQRGFEKMMNKYNNQKQRTGFQ